MVAVGARALAWVNVGADGGSLSRQRSLEAFCLGDRGGPKAIPSGLFRWLEGEF